MLHTYTVKLCLAVDSSSVAWHFALHVSQREDQRSTLWYSGRPQPGSNAAVDSTEVYWALLERMRRDYLRELEEVGLAAGSDIQPE